MKRFRKLSAASWAELERGFLAWSGYARRLAGR
jgi:hypothetical protein